MKRGRRDQRESSRAFAAEAGIPCRTISFIRIEQSRFYDWAMRLPIVLYSLYALVHDVIGFSGQVAQEPAMWAHADAGVIIATLARVSQWMFLALLARAPAVPASPDREIDRFAAAVCRAGDGLHSAVLRAARSRSAKSLVQSDGGGSRGIGQHPRRVDAELPRPLIQRDAGGEAPGHHRALQHRAAPAVSVRASRCRRHPVAGTLAAGSHAAGTHRGAADCARTLGRSRPGRAHFRNLRPTADKSRS